MTVSIQIAATVADNVPSSVRARKKYDSESASFESIVFGVGFMFQLNAWFPSTTSLSTNDTRKLVPHALFVSSFGDFHSVSTLVNTQYIGTTVFSTRATGTINT